MPTMYAAFDAWKEKFKAEIVDMGGRLRSGGKVVRSTRPMNARVRSNIRVDEPPDGV